MGMEQVVMLDRGQAPSWPRIRDLLASHGFPVQLRMIEGELAFPDELPPESWREIRVGTPQAKTCTPVSRTVGACLLHRSSIGRLAD